MAIINRLLSIVILLVALAAVAVGFMLFGKRTELRQRGNKMAQTVEAMATALDQNSGSNFASQLDVSDDGRTGALGYSNFAKLDSAMETAKQAAASVREQRDKLATSMQTLAVAMGLGEQVPPGTLKNLAGYEEKANIVSGYWNNVEERDEALITGIETLADIAGARVARGDLAKFGDRPAVEAAIDKVEAQLNQLKKSRKNLEMALQGVAQALNRDDLAARADQLTASDIETLGDMIRQQREQVEDLQNAKNELSKVKGQLSDLNTQIETMHHDRQIIDQKVTQLQDTLKQRDEDISRLQALFAVDDDTRTNKDLAGSIVDVNYDWNYVVINLGKEDDLPSRLEMTVARGSEYICKVLVRKVYKDYAVADIMTDLKQGQPIEGDSVLYVASSL